MAKLLKYDGADVVSKYAENDTKGRKISTSIDDINQKIADLKAVGRFLSVWDCTTGKPTSNPPGQAPYDYTYQTGDYYIIGVVGTNNYKPTGTKYTGAASSVVESNAVYANDFYRYAGNGDWQLISSSQRTITFSMIEGEVNTNGKLVAAFDAKQNKITSSAKLSPSLISTDANNRFTTDSEKASWDAKQSALSSSNKLNPSYIDWNDNYASVTKNNKNAWDAKQSALSSSNKLDPAYISWNTNYRAVTDSDKTAWTGKQDALSDTQLNAVNSGITAAKVSTYDGYATTIAGKQAALVSGTNIKTINDQSILGQGNLSVVTDISHLMPKSGGTFTGHVAFSSTTGFGSAMNFTGMNAAITWKNQASDIFIYDVFKVTSGTLGLKDMNFGSADFSSIFRGSSVSVTGGSVSISATNDSYGNITLTPGTDCKVQVGTRGSGGTITYSKVITAADLKITAEDYTIGS